MIHPAPKVARCRSDAPTGAEDIVAARLNEDASLVVEIPGSAFSLPGTYAVGAGGLRSGLRKDTSGVNSIASVMASGVMVFQAVSVSE